MYPFQPQLIEVLKTQALFISYLEGVKQTALAIDHRLAALKLYTKGILFAGTPHRGSNMAKWICTATKFASLVQSDRNTELIRMLKSGSEKLDDIQEDFKQIVESFAVYSLLEEIPFRRIGKVRYGQALPPKGEGDSGLRENRLWKGSLRCLVAMRRKCLSMLIIGIWLNLIRGRRITIKKLEAS